MQFLSFCCFCSYHVRCDAHVLALVIRDAILKYNSSIKRIRSVVKYVTGSHSRLATFKDYCTIERIDSKKGLILDVKTRWNSTYLMLEAAEKYERVFNRLAKNDKEFQKKYIFPEDESFALPNIQDILSDIDNSDLGELSSNSSSSSESDSESVNANPRGRKLLLKKKKKTKSKQHAPYAKDWDYARGLVKCFKVFFDCTVKFSASAQVTSHTFL